MAPPLTSTSTRRAASIEAFDARLVTAGRPLEGRVTQVFTTAALAHANAPSHTDAPSGEGGPRQLTLLAPGRPLVPWSLAFPEGEALPTPGMHLRIHERTLTLWKDASGADAEAGAGAHAGTDDGAHAEAGRTGRVFLLIGHGRQLCFPPVGPPGLGTASAPAATPEERRLAAIRALPLPPRTRALLGWEAPSGSSLDGRTIALAAERLHWLLAAFAPPNLSEAPSATDAPPNLSDAPPGENAPRALCKAVLALSGLGPGATPTGDDLLVGLLAAAWRLRDVGLLRERPLAALMEAIRSIPSDHTTPAAQAMLEEACEGFFPEPLLTFLCLLVPAPPEGACPAADTAPSLEAAARALLHIGHQSGADLLAGALALVSRF